MNFPYASYKKWWYVSNVKHESLIFKNITYATYSFPVDNFPPTITCAANVNEEIQCGQTSAQVNFLATATDNCGAATVTYSSQGSTNFFSQSQSTATMNVGLSTITATATDTSGRTATCTTQVNINEGTSAMTQSFIFLHCQDSIVHNLVYLNTVLRYTKLWYECKLFCICGTKKLDIIKTLITSVCSLWVAIICSLLIIWLNSRAPDLNDTFGGDKGKVLIDL